MKLPFFGKKKRAERLRGRGYVPIDRARELMGRGFSEIDTIDVLRREGFAPDEIDKALEQSIRGGAVGVSPPVSRGPPATAPPTMPPTKTGFQSLGQTYERFQQAPAPVFPPRRTQPTPTPSPVEKKEERLELPTIEELSMRAKPEELAVPETTLPVEYYQGYPTEEYIDYVVQEHMQDVHERINEFSMRYKELENRIIEMSERLKGLSKVRAGEQQKIIGRIDNFNETLNDVNMRIASLEKAFKETLPALIESVRALSDIVQRFKREA